MPTAGPTSFGGSKNIANKDPFSTVGGGNSANFMRYAMMTVGSCCCLLIVCVYRRSRNKAAKKDSPDSAYERWQNNEELKKSGGVAPVFHKGNANHKAFNVAGVKSKDFCGTDSNEVELSDNVRVSDIGMDNLYGGGDGDVTSNTWDDAAEEYDPYANNEDSYADAGGAYTEGGEYYGNEGGEYYGNEGGEYDGCEGDEYYGNEGEAGHGDQCNDIPDGPVEGRMDTFNPLNSHN
jgi:hypothetical protein